MFGKLNENGNLEILKLPIKIDDEDVFTNDAEILNSLGLYEVIDTKVVSEDGYYFVPYWERQENRIVKVWEKLPIPTPEDEEATTEDYEEALGRFGV